MNSMSWIITHAIERKILEPRRAKSWLTRHEPFVHTTPRGLRFELHPREWIDGFIYRDGIYERRFLDLIRAYFRRYPGSVALDVGSNIGNHACFLHDCFTQIHCFDPNPVVIARLQRNLELNGIGNIIVNSIGLSDSDAELQFHINLDGAIGNSHFTDAPDEKTVPLKVTAGDNYVTSAKLARIDFIKVDVEGHEIKAFIGLRETIAAHRPIIAFEHHGGQVPLATFTAIAATMPDYIFVEAHHAEPDLSPLQKLRWHAARRGRPILERITTPEPRTYENILALPDLQTLDRLESL
jgi:FkbM family methyltransferase